MYELSVRDSSNEYLLNLFLASKRIEGKRESTIDRYRFVVNKLLGDIDKSLSDITTNDIRLFMARYKRKNSNTTMDGMRRVLSSFFGWLEAEDYILKSPVRKISKIKHDTVKERPYTSAEMEALMVNASNIRDKTILAMLYSTAIRVSELSKINVEDIDYVAKLLHIVDGKGGEERYVPLESKTLFYLDEYFKYRDTKGIRCQELFVSNKKPYRRMQPSAIRAMLNRVAEKAAVAHAHPHRYRVTRITVLLKRGMKLEEVQVVAGHKDINTTASYNRCDLSLVDAEFRRKS